MARLRHVNISNICYVPTNDSEEEGEAFYKRLQKEVEKTPWHYVIIVMGDMNAKVGIYYDKAINENG
ncbi:hypothetical protein XELAEV_18039918mg [Xenopus laevis]|uniref:Craniofacial development protein 2-like n=1 Tax=Xenopus laevis TaxID=8355 RepID=A0A974C8P9_XENLA|nr:hypothetical protein XELAEV_18039918mg [Xenopus laevis]